MKYCKNYCEEKEISTSELNEAQRTLYYIAENMKIDKSISEEGYRHFQMAIKALEQEICEGAISRQAVIDTIHKTINQFFDVCDGDEEVPLSDKDKLLLKVNKAICNNIKALEQEPNIGHWITTRTFMHDGEYYCDKCKCESPNNEKWDYCPNCGARMGSDKK